MPDSNLFSKTERAILIVLSDGKRHPREELMECCGERSRCQRTVNQHLSNIRKKLQRYGEDIVCVYSWGSYRYQHVRLLQSPYNGLT